MNGFYEGELSQQLIPLLEPVVLGLTKSKYIEMYLKERGKTISMAEIRDAGINPEKALRLNESLSLSALDFLNEHLPPGNYKSEAKALSQLSSRQEADIRIFALQQHWDGPKPIISPLQQLLDDASKDMADMKNMIVAHGTRYNYGHHPNLVEIYGDVPCIDSLPVEKPYIYFENKTYATFFVLPIETESTILRFMPGGFPRSPHLMPRTDLYVVTDEQVNAEISKFVDETTPIKNYFHGLSIANHQDSSVQHLKSSIIRAFKPK